MSQYDLGTIDTSTSGTQLATKLGASGWPDAVETFFSGTAAQSYFLDGAIWMNTSGSPNYVLTYNKGAGVGTSISIGTIDRTNNKFVVAGIGVDVQGYDADTAKVDVSQSWTKQQYFNEGTITFVAGGVTWGLDDACVAKITLTANMTGTFDAGTTLRAGGTYALSVIQDGTGGRTIATWASKFKWGADGVPTLSTTASARDIFTFLSDGTNLYCIGRALGF